MGDRKESLIERREADVREGRLANQPDWPSVLRQTMKYMTHTAMCARTIERGDWECSCGFNAAYDNASVALLHEGRN